MVNRYVTHTNSDGVIALLTDFVEETFTDIPFFEPPALPENLRNLLLHNLMDPDKENPR